MYCISVSYRKTPVEIRQRFSFDIEEQERFLLWLKKAGTIGGGVIVSTCNRSEIYFTGGKHAPEAVIEQLEEEKQIEESSIKKYCLIYGGRRALHHLFAVVCGLDSMVLGEDEILHQVKESYLNADSWGCLDAELNMSFQGALGATKQAKTSTRLSTTPVSIGTLSANTVEQYWKEHADLPKCALVVGVTGKIGSIVAKDLLAKGIEVFGTARHRHTREEIVLQGMEGVTMIAFEERYRFIGRVAAVISATTSPHYIFTGEDYAAQADVTGGRLFLDLAVPYDIDKKLGELSGITLYDIDYFRELSRENQNLKQGELEKVKGILAECEEDTVKKLCLHEFHAQWAGEEADWFWKMIYYLKDTLSGEEFETVLQRIHEKKKV